MAGVSDELEMAWRDDGVDRVFGPLPAGAGAQARVPADRIAPARRHLRVIVPIAVVVAGIVVLAIF